MQKPLSIRPTKEIEKKLEKLIKIEKDKKGTVLDEGMAREVEKIFGIEVHGSLYLIFLMIKKEV